MLAPAAWATPSRGEIASALEQAHGDESALRAQIDANSARIEGLQREISGLDVQLRDAQAEIDRRTARIERLSRRMAGQREAIDELQSDLRVARRRLVDRAVNAYMRGDAGYAAVLIQAESLTDLLDKRDIVAQLVAADERLVRDIDELRARITRANAETRRTRAERLRQLARTTRARRLVARRRSRFARAQASLLGALAQQNRMLNSTIAREQLLEANAAALEAASRRLESTIRVAPALAPTVGASSVASAMPSGDWSGGLPVSGSIVSGFGPRGGRLHKGVDVSAPAGTPIHTTGGGTVTYSGWMDGYGNVVVVDHGNGLSTTYAHQSRTGVTAGQTVGAGQTIGYVGCTGRCYGDHVHYETRRNGVPTDPTGHR